MCFDRDEEMDPNDVRLAAEDFISADSIRRRGTFVKAKGWFKLHTALKALLRDWTIIQHARKARRARRRRRVEGANEALVENWLKTLSPHIKT